MNPNVKSNHIYSMSISSIYIPLSFLHFAQTSTLTAGLGALTRKCFTEDSPQQIH